MTQNKNLVAVAGGIGSGKSTVLDLLKKYGDVLSCDKINAEMLRDEQYLAKLKIAFPDAFTPEFDRKRLSSIIFSDEKSRKKLNDIAHPEIARRLQNAIDGCEKDTIFIEVPLLAGTGFDKLFKKIIVVTAPNDVRRKRIEARDGVDSATALKKMEGQKGEYLFPHAKVYYLDNGGCLADLEIQCDRLAQENVF